MTIEKKKKRLDLLRVQMAKEEMLFKIDERLEEIERLKQGVRVQEEKEKELLEEIGD